MLQLPERFGGVGKDTNYNMLTRTDWPTIKVVKALYSFPLYYVQDGSFYTIVEGNVYHQYWTVIKEASDITDFENNFKSTSISVLSEDDAISRILYGIQNNTDIINVLNSILVQLGGSGTSNVLSGNNSFRLQAAPPQRSKIPPLISGMDSKYSPTISEL